ncbi:putative ammonium transporter 1 [Lycorma delicatula]|uniref:putative ammonium transporter 1 n=1 Tax=Lycorma delicatula TaxID=130591 RepID=UPI003F5155B3
MNTSTAMEFRNVTSLDSIEELRKNIDDVFLLTNGIIVSLMQTGFACLEAGCIRSKNVTNIIMKNLLDLFISAISYWLIGYTLAYSQGNQFLGYSNWAGIGLSDDKMSHWFFQFVFAATAATIISGAVAERCNYIAYICYCAVLSGFVYPVVSHWAWTNEGFLNKMGYSDFAGSGVVHALAGTASFIAALFIGPRTGRFTNGKSQDMPGHSTMLTGLGGLLLISGFLAFNGGSLGHMTYPGDGAIIARAISNTIYGGCGAGVIALILTRSGIATTPSWSFSFALNGILAGMVSVCASANTLPTVGCFTSGAIACFIFWGLRSFMEKIRVDDPLDAVAVHFGGGFWGVISGPLLEKNGLIHGITTKSTQQLLNNFYGVVIIIIWSLITSIVLFGILKITGYLRVSEEEELKGLDVSLHGEPAYPSTAWGGITTEKQCIKVQEMPNELQRDYPMQNKTSYSLKRLEFDNFALDMNSEHQR